MTSPCKVLAYALEALKQPAKVWEIVVSFPSLVKQTIAAYQDGSGGPDCVKKNNGKQKTVTPDAKLDW